MPEPAHSHDFTLRRGASMIRRSKLVWALMALFASQSASAGPLLDAWRERRAAQKAADGGELMGEPGSDLPASVPAGTKLLRDQCYGSDPKQCLDVYIPANAKSAPIIFMVHGGAWMIGDKASGRVVNNKAAYWLPRGYLLVSINYRLSRNPDPLLQARDVADALAYVQKHSEAWGGDGSRVAVMGHSAGAHLAALVASSRTLIDSAGVKPWKATILLDSAALDVPGIMDSKHYGFYDRVFGTSRSHWEATSPYHQLDTAPAPTLIVCSTRRSDSCPQGQAYAAKVQKLGGRAVVKPVEMSHSDVNATVGAAGALTSDIVSFLTSNGLP